MRLVNIYNNRRTIHLFCRDEKGALSIRKVTDFFPYYYEYDKAGFSMSYTGEKLRKIYVSEPKDIPKKRSANAWEADILFTKRYLIDKIKELEKCPIKYAFIDIEVLTEELPDVKEAKYPISSISIYNSFTKLTQTFYLEDYETEHALMTDFISYMKEEQFDLWLSWHVKFDYNYCYNRFPDFAKDISPVNKSRYGDGEIYYPAGISIIDYLTWFKRITMNRRKSYALDNIIKEEFGIERKKIGFSKLSIELKKKNREDVEYLQKIEEKYKVISYYDEIRRLAKVEWEDMVWNSRVIDMLLLQEARKREIRLPMKPADNEKENYLGAFREAFQTGAFFGAGAYDISGAYPNMIIDFCLDPANITNKDELNKEFKYIEIDGTYFKQNPTALLPTVVNKLLFLKDNRREKLSTLELNSSEYKNMKTKYDAIKTIVNSAYGTFANRFFRLYSTKTASATTFLVRDLLKYMITKLKELGYEVIYSDTDGLMIKNNIEDISQLLNKLVNQWAQTYGKSNLNTKFVYEGFYEKLLILSKCRYFGYLKTDKGIEEKVIGIESKRKDSTTWMRKFQKELIEKILDKISKEDIIEWIKLQILTIRQASIEDIAFPCRLARKPQDYRNIPIFLRALNNTPELKKKVGNSFYYIYVTPNIEEEKTQTIIKVKNTENISYQDIVLDKNLSRKEGIEYARAEFNEPNLESSKISVLHKKEKAKDVVAFDENNNKHIDRDKIDWKKIIGRNIFNKIEVIFSALSWDLGAIIND